MIAESIGTLVEVEATDGGEDLGADHLFLQPGDDHEEADEHDQQRPVDVEIDLLRLDPPGDEKEGTAEDCDLGDRLAGEEERDHRERDRDRLDDQRPIVAGRPLFRRLEPRRG